jgi:hypothetical protein
LEDGKSYQSRHLQPAIEDIVSSGFGLGVESQGSERLILDVPNAGSATFRCNYTRRELQLSSSTAFATSIKDRTGTQSI